MQDRDLILYPVPHIQCSQPRPFPVGLKCRFQLGCADFCIVPAKLFYVIHCFWQGDALGFRQEHHKSTADGCQGTCGTGKQLQSPDGTAARIAPAPPGSRCAHHPNSPAPRSSALVRSPCPAPQRSSVTISQFLSVLRPWTVPPPLRSWRPSIYSLISYFFIWDLLSAEQSEKRPPPTSGGETEATTEESLSILQLPPSLPSSRRVTRQGWSPRLPRSSSWSLLGCSL